MVKTDHMLFIASGAFHTAKPSDLIPELQGRLPIRVELKALSVRLYEASIKFETRKVLIDEMALELTGSIVHQVELIKFYSENLPPEIREYKVAVAVDPKYRDLADFWNLYGSNRGFPWRGVTSLEAAIQWIEQVDDQSL